MSRNVIGAQWINARWRRFQERIRSFALLLFSLPGAWCPLLAPQALAQSLTDSQLAQVNFQQKPGAEISLDLSFRDEDGKQVHLRDYFTRGPVVLVLGYYECPMLCTLSFNGMVESLAEMKWSIGREFEVIHVSINPAEKPALAAAKKRTYLKRYGRAGAGSGWHFLTGEPAAIQTLSRQTGFQYVYDSTVKQYAHPSGLIVLTPHGKIAQYLFGVKFSATDFFEALQRAASEGRGAPLEQQALLCFHYSPIKGKYGAVIMLTLRLAGAAFLLALAGFLIAAARARKAVLSPARPSASATGIPEALPPEL